MPTPSDAFRREAQEYLDRFYGRFPNPDLQKRANKALRYLASEDEPPTGEARAWAGGIVYALGAFDTPATGIPGVINAELKETFATDPGWIIDRAAAVRRRLAVFPCCSGE